MPEDSDKNSTNTISMPFSPIWFMRILEPSSKRSSYKAAKKFFEALPRAA